MDVALRRLAEPGDPIKESADMIEDFAELSSARTEADAGIDRWVGKVDEARLGDKMVWWSDAANRELRAPKRPL